MAQFEIAKILKGLNIMKKQEFLKESANVIESLNEETIATLKALSEAEEKQIVDFQNIEHYEQFQTIVKEGYAEKDYRHYSITEKGKELLEGVELFQKQPQKFQKLVKEDVEGQIVIEYKMHDEEKNIICNETATFDVEKDGLPVIVVNEEAYAGLIHRTKGQHWKQYLGEDGRNLIRQKKLERFYVEDEETARRYLYIVPKK
jgi:predicted transcriptional regulator